MQDAFGVERGEVSKAEGTKWRLSAGEQKAAKGSKKDQALSGGAAAAYGIGAGGAFGLTHEGTKNIMQSKSERKWADTMRAWTAEEKADYKQAKAAGLPKKSAKHLRNALRHNVSGAAAEKAAPVLMRRGATKIGLGMAAGAAGAGALIANNNRQYNRINAYRKSKGEAPRSKLTGFPKD